MMISCRLLRCNEVDQWVMFSKPCGVLVGAGLMIRESVSNALLVDYPKTCIRNVKLLDEGKLAVLESDSMKERIALKFDTLADSIMFGVKLKEQGIPCRIHKSEEAYPDLKHKETREHVKHLLVSSSFQEFASELMKLIEELKLIDQIVTIVSNKKT